MVTCSHDSSQYFEIYLISDIDVEDGFFQQIVDCFTTKLHLETRLATGELKFLTTSLMHFLFMACHLSRGLTFTNPRSVKPLYVNISWHSDSAYGYYGGY